MWHCRLVALIGAFVVTACSTPTVRIEDVAQAHGFQGQRWVGTGFEHVVYFNGVRRAGDVLHVYIEGDGTPYLNRWTIAADPTPRRPLMLQLMALDAQPAVYVGRPCYFGLSQASPCTPEDWTTGRFSERVVDSMAGIVERALRDGGYRHAEIFGHSGGGALAVLLARRLPQVTTVITLAGNLDIDAWSDLHRYSRLEQSLNPVREGALPAAIRQRHCVGERDEVTPPWLVDAAARSLGAGGAQTLPGVTHSRGWEAHWPALLAGQ